MNINYQFNAMIFLKHMPIELLLIWIKKDKRKNAHNYYKVYNHNFEGTKNVSILINNFTGEVKMP